MNIQKEMDKIKVESYKDCVWYIEDEDRCKLPGIGSATSECYCKDRELEDFCIWITKFFKSTSGDVCEESWDKILSGLYCDGGYCNEKKDSFISRFISNTKKKIFK